MRGARYEAARFGNPTFTRTESDPKRIDELASLSNSNLRMVQLLVPTELLNFTKL